ncbi:MAG: hypothetical protein EBT63_04895 [Proteobacteria bacterium]|nr:hypothetical protein [Pseudomonadota bacterium]NCA28438.1 hypothetical protein [Pseudomonadota bacterium]
MKNITPKNIFFKFHNNPKDQLKNHNNNKNIKFINCQKWSTITKNNIFNYLSFLLLVFIFSCSSDKKYDKSKAIAVLNQTNQLVIDNNLDKIPISIPASRNNHSWLGSSSLVNQNIENITKNFNSKETSWYIKNSDINIKRTWYKNIFYIEDFAKSFVYSPIIINDKIFVLDSSGELTAFLLSTKKTIWHKRIFNKLWLKNYKVAHLGACDNKLFAVVGVNQIKAINQDDGKILWEKDLSVIFNSTPICDGESVFITSSDNKTYALNALDGEIKWIHYGIPKSLAIFGNAQVVISEDLAIASYSSGEIYAINKKSGKELWSSELNSNQNYNSNFFLSDVDATPLVKDGVVYAIGNGGLMKAIMAKNGDEKWNLPITSVVDFWLAGDFLYVINNDNQLFAVYKKTGTIKWQVQLEKFRNPKKISSKHNYIAVVMAGNKLLVARQDGEMLIISPFDGKVEKNYSLNKRILHAPIVIDNKIYFYGMSRFKTKLIELE